MLTCDWTNDSFANHRWQAVLNVDVHYVSLEQVFLYAVLFGVCFT